MATPVGAETAPPEASPPEAPNTNRPKQANIGKAENRTASPVVNEAAGSMLENEAVLKHIDSIIASKLPGLVESSISSRVSGKDIDAMIVASVASRDMAPSTQTGPAPSTSAVDQTDMLVKKQAEMEQRVWERLQVDVQNMLHNQMAEMDPANSRPVTGPRPFTSEAQSRSGPQTKATWASSTLYSVAAVPNHDASRALNHFELEGDLTEKVLANQPDRSALGFSEIIMRDIANSVVRELVGIFESLLDRLLIEKKQHTLRTLVAELVTEDTLRVNATVFEQLKQMELGHITRELERLGLEGREREQSWDDRFLITQELRDSQDDLYATFDERCRGIEGRLIAIEQNKCERSELDQRLQQKLDEGQAFRKEVYSVRERIDDVTNQLAEQQRQSTHNFVSRTELANCQEQLGNDITGCQNKITNGLQELREHTVPKSDLQSTRTELDERLTTLNTSLLQATQQNISAVEAALKKAESFNDEVFCTKTMHSESCSKLEKEAAETNTKVFTMLDDLETAKATKSEVEEMRTSISTSLSDIKQTVAKTSSGLDRTTGSLDDLKQRVDQDFATKLYVKEEMQSRVEEMVQRSDTKEELGRLKKDIESERERLRQSVNQQQTNLQALNNAIEEIQSLQNGAVDVVKRCEVLGTSLTEVDGRETNHWEQGQEGLRQQRQVHDDLEVFYKALREEFIAHSEIQKAENERVKNHSTLRYMEQIDRALNLTESVEKVVRENREINDSIKSIKLPTL